MDVLGRTVTLERDESVTKLVKNEAGEWLAVDNAGIKVYIPPGALGAYVDDLDNDIEIEITLTALAGDRVVFEFAPHGLKFLKPILIQIKTDDIEAAYLKEQNTPSGYLDDILGVSYVGEASSGTVTPKETFPVYYDDGAFLQFEIEHFSGYALASGGRRRVDGLRGTLRGGQPPFREGRRF